MLSFHIRGRVLNTLQESHHYYNTLGRLADGYIALKRAIVFLEHTAERFPGSKVAWEKAKGEDFIRSEWDMLDDRLGRLVRQPTAIDIIRARQLDFDALYVELKRQIDERVEFLDGLDSKGTSYDHALYDFTIGGNITETNRLTINLPTSEIDEISETMEALAEDMKAEVWGADFSDITVDELRLRIETFNNLIVRLPTDTETNKTTSRHIFQDWRRFVEDAVENLEQQGLLFRRRESDAPDAPLVVVRGYGTDGVEHPYVEVYTDDLFSTPLVDYSYIEVEDIVDEDTGETSHIANHDRFDYWSEDDFR